MGRKHLFSLIEIAVAMAVAAIGVAAIMALIPISIKSTSDSVGDTLAADAANTVIAQLDRAAWEHFDWIQSLKTSKPDAFKDKKALEYANMSLDSNASYRIEPASGLQDGHFVFFFGPSGEESENKKSDFAAEVICWRSKDKELALTALDSATGKPKTPIAVPVHPDTKKAALVRVFIEISWPIAKPYYKKSGNVIYYPRQSRTFVREYFDPTYYKNSTN